MCGWCSLFFFLFRTHFSLIRRIDVKEILHEFGERRDLNRNNKLFQMCLMELSILAQMEFAIKLKPNAGSRYCDGDSECFRDICGSIQT